MPPPGEVDPLEIPGGDELFGEGSDRAETDDGPQTPAPGDEATVAAEADDGPEAIDDPPAPSDPTTTGPPRADTAGPAGADTAGPAGADTGTLVRERDDYLRALQHLQADFENYKKRVERQREEQSARAARDLVNKLLPVLDTLDLAEAHLGGSDEPSPESKALSQARVQLLDVLQREGLERVDQEEVVFDPEAHDAVAYSAGDDEDSDDEETGSRSGAAGSNGSTGQSMVEEVLRSGYRWRGQTLRPAMVRVRG